MSRRALRTGFALAIIAFAAAIAYAPSFAVPFQFDDEARLSHNVAMQQGAFLDALRWLGNSRVVALSTLGTFDHVVPKMVERRPDGSVVLEVEDAATCCPRDGPS